jgi:haloacid dehalogenase superfamily, subfamily IA, variant 3 with third motif having DD or ED
MDGTLIDSEPTWIESQIALVAEHGGSWSYSDGLTLVGADMEATAQRLQARGVQLPATAIIGRLTREVTESLRRGTKWRPGARELVEALRDRGTPQAIVTTSPLSMAKVIADALPVGAVTTIVAGEHVSRGKPDPEPYLLAAQALGVEIRGCIAIEDSPTGLTAAITAGTIAIGVPHDAALQNAGRWTRLRSLAGVTVTDLERLVARRG